MKKIGRFYLKYRPFIEWLREQMRLMGLNQNETARRGAIKPSQISNVFSGRSRPGEKFCRAMATALSLPPSEVFQRAGLMPEEISAGGLSTAERELLTKFRQLSPEDQHEAQRYIQYMLAKTEKNDNLEDRIDNLDNVSRRQMIAAAETIAQSRRHRQTSQTDSPPQPDQPDNQSLP